MKRIASIQLAIAIICGLFVLGAGARVAYGDVAVRVVDDDRAQCPAATDTTIQSAVGAVGPGGRVEVCPGLYSGPVYVSNASVSIQAVSQPGVPHTPAAAADRASCL